MDFEQVGHTWRGEGLHGRVWLITPIAAGWRLQFFDAEGPMMNSGVYSSAEAAMRGAQP
jgi:hypothetical protein